MRPLADSARFLTAVQGSFFRAVDRGAAVHALDGSIRAGRYSRPSQRTLYLSASRQGVAAAMQAHRNFAARGLIVLQFEVAAERLFDLREPGALEQVRAAAGDPLADWRPRGADRQSPESWRARDWIEEQGAHGLIDPSRTAPGLWHLVLFRWNSPGAPTVVAAGEHP